MRYELGIIGGGNMAEAILRAVVDNHIISAERIVVSEPQAERRAMLEPLGVALTDDNQQVVAGSSQVMLAVKPQTLAAVSDSLKAVDPARQIVLSIMAGVSTRRIAEVTGKPARVIRIMPNTPLLVGLGMSAIAMGEHARSGDELLSLQIFRAAGEAVMVHETQMDAVTAVSGSGPAYVFYLAEAMTDAARQLGLDDASAKLLVQQTILGAAKLMKDSSDDPAALRRKVTSPGGTTQAAIEHMESSELKRHIIDALGKAASRSRELGK